MVLNLALYSKAKSPKIRASLLVAALSLGLGACASYTDETREVVSAYRSGNYEQALSKLDGSDIKEQSRNQLLYFLERAMILDRLSQRDDSRQLLLKSDQLIDKLYTTSVSKEAATYFYNEGAQSYAGEDYEKVAVHTMLAHSFIEDGRLDAARVEALKINSRLSEINGFYEENKNHYKEDAYARYLAAMIYESRGEDDSAIVDYRNALKVYENDYAKFFANPVPDQLVHALYKLLIRRSRQSEAQQLKDTYKINLSPKEARDSSEAELVIIHEVGHINRKERAEFMLPLGGQLVRFSFPAIRAFSYPYGRTGVTVDGQASTYGELGQNLNLIASKTLDDRRTRTVLKSGARLLLKGQLTQKAQKEFGPLGGLVGNLYGAVTETADTRSWTLLPAAFVVTRVTLKAGEHSVTIYNDGRVVGIKSVRLQAGQLQIVRVHG